MGCHDKELRAADGRTIPNMAAAVAGADLVHGPVAAGQCAACHSVHGSLHARLLKQVDPDMLSPGDGFDIRNYALCFACHDQNLASPDAPGATQFRDGDRNLHAQHLRSERSHGCSDCHAVHTSRRPRLMADTVAYEGSAWNMPVAFVLEPEGGSCAPGCHEQIGYNRRVPQGRRPDMQGGKQ
jgi:predicted CXXCH cytochrome family protein